MQDLEKASRKSQYRLILTIIFMFFVIVMAYTMFWELRYYTKYNHFQKVEAEVISHEIEDEKTYDVIKYSVDSIEYETVTNYESKNEIGDKIYIYYDINSPIGVIYSLDFRRYLLPIITVMFGGVWTCLLIMYKKSYPKTKLKEHKKRETPVDILLQNKID